MVYGASVAFVGGMKPHDCDDKREPYGYVLWENIHARFDQVSAAVFQMLLHGLAVGMLLPDVGLHS